MARCEPIFPCSCTCVYLASRKPPLYIYIYICIAHRIAHTFADKVYTLEFADTIAIIESTRFCCSKDPIETAGEEVLVHLIQLIFLRSNVYVLMTSAS